MSISSVTPGDVERAAKQLWWLVLVQGIAAVVFGLLAIFHTVGTVKALVVLFGIYAIVDGLLALAASVGQGQGGRGWLVFQGIMGIVIGIVALRFPRASVLALLLVIAVWALAIGLVQIFGSFQAKALGGSGWGWILASGIVNVLFGLLLVVNPVTGVTAILWIVGIYAVIFGIMLIGSAFAARSLLKDLASSPA